MTILIAFLLGMIMDSIFNFQIVLGNWLYKKYPDSWLRYIWWSSEQMEEFDKVNNIKHKK